MSYVSSKHPSLWTVLHHAAHSRSAGLQVIQAIIEAGAYLSLKNWEGDTAYDIAVARGREEQINDALKLPKLLTEKEETIKTSWG